MLAVDVSVLAPALNRWSPDHARAAGLLEDLVNGERPWALPWPVVHDNASDPLERLQMTFGIAHLPTVLLLNKEGTVVSLEARGAELERLMQMLFEAPTPAATAAAPDAEAPAARSVLEPSATDAPPDGQ